MSDIVERARKHEECVRLEGCENHDLILEMAAEIERLSLSLPQAEEIRHEALKEAAKVADEAQASAREEVGSDKEKMGKDYDPYSFGAGFLSGEITASINIATAIRALRGVPQ